MPLQHQQVYERIKARFPDAVEEVVEGEGEPFCVVKKEFLILICEHLKDDADLKFELLVCVSGTDDLKNLWVELRLTSSKKNLAYAQVCGSIESGFRQL